MAQEYNLNIKKASNGWIVVSHSGRPGDMANDIMVALDDSDLAGLIAAAIVGQKLQGVGDPEAEYAQRPKASNGLIRKAVSATGPTPPQLAKIKRMIDNNASGSDIQP